MRDVTVKRGAGDADRGIGIEHQAERGEHRTPAGDKQIGQRRRQRACRRAERADQAVTREHLGAALIGSAMREHGMLERHQHAEIAAGRIDGADKGDQHDQDEMLDTRERNSGGRHQARAEHQ